MVVLCALAAIGGVQGTAPVLNEGWLSHPRRLMVQGPAKEAQTHAESLGGRVLQRLDEISVSILEFPQHDLVRAKRRLQSEETFGFVHYDRAARIAYEPNDPLWPDMWHMRAIRANEAWDLHKGSPNVVVAVIDTGVNVNHEDLAANIWVNQDEIPNNGLDDDANGYVDDVNGYDFTYGDPNPDDVNGHGTACSGLVAAIQDNAKGGTGVAPLVKVMAIKAAQDDGYFYDSATVPAYIYCANNGAKVLSMSYFSDRVSPSERAALEFCVWKGVLPIAAAGNASTVYTYYPAAYESVVSVAALATNLTKAGFSNHGSWVDVSAPGTSLRTSTTSGGYTTSFGGTSGACPHAAGVAALILSAKPNASVAEVRAILEDSATLQTQAPFGEFANYGLVDARRALETALNLSVPDVKPSKVRGAEWLPGGFNARSRPRQSVRVYGRGLNRADLRAWFGSRLVRPSRAARDYAEFAVPSGVLGRWFRVVAGAEELAAYPLPLEAWSVPMREASVPGGGSSVNGGFAETMAADGVSMVVTRRNDGNILVHGTLKVPTGIQRGVLRVVRRYPGSAGGTERLRVYDWSTASFPYGSFVELFSGPPPTGMTEAAFVLNNVQTLADDEGILYFQILTTDQASGVTLELDRVAFTG
ncbi:MAG: S8 family serine peptidase [Fimbriimonadaceae bacterium]|nr:S8 family serine peptidase [Fimbriimonadaceae bacterium]